MVVPIICKQCFEYKTYCIESGQEFGRVGFRHLIKTRMMIFEKYLGLKLVYIDISCIDMNNYDLPITGIESNCDIIPVII